MSIDYKSTVHLPKTAFPMKAGLARREPEMLERWRKMDLYGRLREKSKGREKFVLHDGPPYANGHLHIGHALNKILKDVICRSQRMLGKDSCYVPGWDCHGLPIEWKIEEKYRKKGKDKDSVPIVAFRRECREFAEKWIDIQREEFKRLGVLGRWDAPYTTMSFAAEAQIVRELGKFLMDGSLYKGARPVLWSVVEKTALAEAEVEYHDHTSDTVYVKFPVVRAATPILEGASVVIWTTTPWTIPGNRAVAFGADIDYVVVEAAGEKLVVAESLIDATLAAGGIEDHKILGRAKGSDLAGTLCRHPFHGQGYDFDVPLLAAAFVDVETGSGFVHIAPGHGADDWQLAVASAIAVPETVDGGGLFMDHVALFAGKHVFKVNGDVIEALRAADALLASGTITHSYPHSWRSKAPLIFRNTAQWFISMEKNDLRKKALAAIDETRFIPAAGRNRLKGMVETRPDWCVSRQRAWGVPITVFVDRKTAEPLRDPEVLERIVAAVEIEGADAWFTSDPARFLGPGYKAEDFDQVMDILDVWFDSGCTHSFVLEADEDLEWPASLYLEGSDQHRGWFHSSLLESCATRGRAPYEAVLTHGFVMAGDGQKMSKSLGNIVSPQEVANQSGIDILRLWVVGSDYSEDLRIGPEIIKQHSDIYRRLRNTLRFLLGNLNGFGDREKIDVSEMPELERWILHRLRQLDGQLRRACADFNFHPFFTELHNFCAVDLSAFYFDTRKDSLYCDAVGSDRRRAARTVLDILFDCLSAWLAPFICFTAEEAWLARHGEEKKNDIEESVHLRAFPDIPDSWRDDDLGRRWEEIRAFRRVVTKSLEDARAAKTIGSSLEADPTVYVSRPYIEALEGLNAADICITSGVTVIEGEPPAGSQSLEDVADIGVIFERAAGEKCERCWKILDEVGNDPDYPTVCGRCADVVRDMDPPETS